MVKSCVVKKVLITGGAGFIGSHLVDLLIEKGYQVRVLDSFHPQVHRERPTYLNPSCEYIEGDIRDRRLLSSLIAEAEGIFHFASRVGVGQSMYQVEEYVDENVRGTSVLLDILANEKHNIQKLVVASSMSIYGEGAYKCERCGVIYPVEREENDLRERIWELKCPDCNTTVEPIPTSEDKPLHPTSIYAQTKRDQEEMSLLIGKTYGIPTVALRFFNVFGSRQALSNPYTGVVAIFSSRIMNGNPPVIFEDGKQTRDFIHVKDVAEACFLSYEKEEANFQVFNVGRGKPVSIREISRLLQKILKKEVGEEITGRFRKGDIRHCIADISKLKKLLSFEPHYSLEEGMEELLYWMQKEKPEDNLLQALQELKGRRLVE